MNKYEVTKLSDKTPKAESEKLQTALQAVPGVEAVTLRPAEHGVSIRFGAKDQPGHETLQAAATKAGFTLGPKI